MVDYLFSGIREAQRGGGDRGQAVDPMSPADVEQLTSEVRADFGHPAVTPGGKGRGGVSTRPRGGGERKTGNGFASGYSGNMDMRNSRRICINNTSIIIWAPLFS